jgi:hypothetical protein
MAKAGALPEVCAGGWCTVKNALSSVGSEEADLGLGARVLASSGRHAA